MKHKGPAPNRRMKRGERAAVSPKGERQSAARPLWAELRRVGFYSLSLCPGSKSLTFFKSGQSTKSGSYNPPIIPPGGPRIPPGRPKKAYSGSPFFDQNFDRFLVSILARFGCLLGSIWGSFWELLAAKLGQVGPQDAFRRLIFFKNVDFAPVLRFPTRKLCF